MHLITNAWGSCILSEDSKFVCLAVFQLVLYWIKDKQFAVVVNLWQIRQQTLNDSKQRS